MPPFVEETRHRLANELCDSRLLFVLEGGYAASGLIEGTRALLTGLTTQDAEKQGEIEPVMAGGRLSAILDRVAAVHGSRYPGLHTT